MRQPKGRLIGYARVSTDEQAMGAQEMELRSAGCDVIVQEHGSGASRARPALSKLLREINAGDTLVAVRLDRLAHSASHLLEVIEDLTARNAHFQSLQDPVDTSTPQGARRRVTARAHTDLRTNQGRHQGRKNEGPSAR
jgi:DNA invertase Pin-like site-specific DNA recombinase